MREALDDEDTAGRPELIAPLRRLIHSVVVHAELGVKGFEVEIKGRLQELIGAPFLTRSVGVKFGSERGTRYHLRLES